MTQPSSASSDTTAPDYLGMPLLGTSSFTAGYGISLGG